MKWSYNSSKIKKPIYEDGEQRTVKRFAFRPTVISDENIKIWLETYYVVQKFCPLYPILHKDALMRYKDGKHFKYCYVKGNWTVIKISSKSQYFIDSV